MTLQLYGECTRYGTVVHTTVQHILPDHRQYEKVKGVNKIQSVYNNNKLSLFHNCDLDIEGFI